MLQPHEPLISAKEKLLHALKSRDVTEINGDRISDDPSAIEFGVRVDRTDPDKGWTRLDADAPELGDDDDSKQRAGKSKKTSGSLRDAGLDDGHSVAFRFRKPSDTAQADLDIDLEDPGWDVVTPIFDDEEE